MPLPDSSSLLDCLRAIVGPGGVLHSPSDLVVYECDGFTIEKNKPDLVVFPTSTDQIVAIVKACTDATGPASDKPGYAITRMIVGAKGTFGVVSKVRGRITRNPEADRALLGVFETVDQATKTHSDIIGAGIIPGALEMLDLHILQAVEA